jgi:catechol 2,3-dioxygenase-like lactoylglutathione lyase family enzyme
VRLAKPFLDVGIYTGRLDEQRAFWEREVGLPYEELLKAGRGIHQHRLGLHGAVLKVNASRDPLDPAPSCLRGLVVHGSSPRSLVDPDGLPVEISHDVETVAVRWASSDPNRLGVLLEEGLGAAPLGDGCWRVGGTQLWVEWAADAAHGPLRAVGGIRYLTVQVHDVVAEHARLLDLGWTEGTAPVRLGDVAQISFVRDPDGVHLEVSQRASLTGPLPDS